MSFGKLNIDNQFYLCNNFFFWFIFIRLESFYLFRPNKSIKINDGNMIFSFLLKIIFLVLSIFK